MNDAQGRALQLVPARLILPGSLSLIAIALSCTAFPWYGGLVLGAVLSSSFFLFIGLVHRVTDEGIEPLGRDVRRTYGLGSMSYLQDSCLIGYYRSSPAETEETE